MSKRAGSNFLQTHHKTENVMKIMQVFTSLVDEIRLFYKVTLPFVYIAFGNHEISREPLSDTDWKLIERYLEGMVILSLLPCRSKSNYKRYHLCKRH